MNRTGLRFFTLILLTSLFWAVSVCFSGTVEDNLFQEGNEAYSRGEYGEAITKYQKLTKTAGYSPAVLFNLANSYALSGNPGKAVLNYERALRLSPSNSDISGNLELVRKENGLFPKQSSGVERFFQLLELNQWTALIPGCLILVTIIFVVDLKYPVSRKISIGAATAALMILCLTITGTLFRYHSFNPSVVVSSEAKLFVSPFESSATIGAVQEGRLVYPQKSHGEFSYVTDETDRKGWIPSSLIEPVCRPAGSDS